MHKSKFIFQSRKKQALLDYLLNGIIKSKRYSLILVSCYFNINSANEIISLLKDSINLSKTSIYIDRGSAINIGKEDITNWIKELSKSVNVSFKIADSASLFHVKAYCLLADDSTCGSLVVGSANLTGNGLTTETGNIELLYEIHNIEDILCFYHELTSNNVQKFIDISELEKFNNTEDDYFKYALLQEGCFVKSNDLSINELLSFTYNFNEKGRKESKSLEFKELELKDKNSYSKNYFEKIHPIIENIFRKYNFSYDIKWGKYGINTDFGYWIPKHIIAYLNREDEKTLKDLECCKSEIKQELTSHLNTAKLLMEDQWKNLLEKDWLTDNFKPQMTKIDNGILNLYIKTETEKHLRKKIDTFILFIDKLLLRYYHLKIPFDFTNQEEIQNLFNILEQSCIRKLGEAEYYAINVEQLALNENEDIKNIFNFYLQDNNTNILFKILSLAITTQNLGFIRLLRREDFIKNVNQNKQFKDK